MDGVPMGAESLWPRVIQWKSVISSNWKNIKNWGDQWLFEKNFLKKKPKTSTKHC
jgi:hypothetical protein